MGNCKAQETLTTRALLVAKGKDPDAHWILVTSAFHMPRAVASFEAAGWADITPWPTDFRGGVFRVRIGWNLGDNLSDLNMAAKEWVGMLAYRLTGRAR